MTKKRKRKEEEEEEWLGRDYIGGSGVETEIREYTVGDRDQKEPTTELLQSRFKS